MTSKPMDTLDTSTAAREPKRGLPPLTLNASLRWDAISRMLPENLGNTLEIGCGRGGVTARIADKTTGLTAIEPDPVSFALAKSNIGHIAELHNCMSYDLPDAQTYNTICAFEVLEHIEDDRSALLEWRGKLKQGGNLILSVPAWSDKMGAWDEIAGHFRRYDPQQLKALLEASGFEDVRVEAYGAPAGYLLEAFRNFSGRRMLADGGKDIDFADRTAGSGRLMQPDNGLSGLLTTIAARPMVWMQRLFKGRGVGLVAYARLPE
uniref:class I SAM-dependent methyltransferase n=1 Tax=uncultured Erythrobacter sp. TaxID=263913 RepID=UPI00262CB731|nr:class I SAM-dependent methyltransferase [uncultured Erythrobacter sp.]